MTRTYAIGDVHGCLSQLQDLVQQCERDAGAERSRFIFLGDYIDRGPDSGGVVEQLITLQQARPDQIICLMGNHEDMLLAALDHPDWADRWLLNGGIRTLKSYGVTDPSHLPKGHIDWLRRLPKSFDDGLRYFVHAGLHPERPLNEQHDFDLLWIRQPFLSGTRDFGKLIVHGHTPTASRSPELYFNRLNLDTGAVSGGPLTAAVFSDLDRDPQRFLFAA